MTATGTVACVPSGTPPRLSNAASAMWGRAHPQGNVALVLPRSPTRLSVSSPPPPPPLPCLAWLQQHCIAIYGNDNFDRQPICPWVNGDLLMDSLCKHIPLLSGLSVVSRLMRAKHCISRFFLCIRLGRLRASLAKGGGVGKRDRPWW